MRGLDGQARIFIGSSSEAKATAETVATALEAAGMRPLLWCNFFKTRDIPLKELDIRMADADGAVLVGCANDRSIWREREYFQMRDNVLLEFGLFAGHLGRHRCVLLMPDEPRFHVPSDLVGVAGFEWYSPLNIATVAGRIPPRLQAGLAADGFHPPSLKERCKRLLLLSSWMRTEIAKASLAHPSRSLAQDLQRRFEAVHGFLKEDIEALDLAEDAEALIRVTRNSLNDLPPLPDLAELRHRLHDGTSEFLRHPFRFELASRMACDRFRHELSDALEPHAIETVLCARANRLCPRCIDDDCRCGGRRPSMHSFFPIGGSYRHYSDDDCLGHGWYMGAVDMLFQLRPTITAFFDTIDRLEDWRHEWVPRILDKLEVIERAIHERVFGHL